MTKYLLLLIVIVIPAFAEVSEIDSLKKELYKNNGIERLKILDKISRFYSQSQTDSTLKYLHILKEEAKKIENYEFWGKSLSYLGYIYSTTGKQKLARKIIDSAIIVTIKTNDSAKIAYAYNQLAVNMYEQGNLDSSLKYFNIALRINNVDNFEQIIDNYKDNEQHHYKIKIFGIIYTDLGLLYLDLLKNDKAIQSFNNALKCGFVLDDNRRIAGTYSNLGMAYQHMGKLDTSLQNYQNALKYIKNTNSSDYETAILNNISIVLTDLEEYKKAVKYLDDAYIIAKEINDEVAILLYYLNKSEILRRGNYYNKSLISLDTALIWAKKLNNPKYFQNIYYSYYAIYDSLNNYDRALNYYKKYHEINDSINSKESISQINSLEVEFDSERKDYEIDLLKKEKELLNYRIYLFIGLLILVIIIVFVLISRNRIKTRANQELKRMNEKLTNSEEELKELNNTKDNFFSIIAHDLKGPIGTYRNTFEFLESGYDKFSEEELKEFIAELKKSADNLFKLLNDLLTWSRAQTGKIKFNPDKINLKYLIDENISIQQLSANKKDITMQSNLEKEIFIIGDANMLTTVLRNLINNAIKFTEEGGKIEINAEESKAEVIVSVRDTGVGMPKKVKEKLFKVGEHHTTKGTENEIGTGLGLILCKEFIDNHKGKIWVESEEGRGSTFSFTIPKS